MCEHITGSLPPDYPTAMPRLAKLELTNLDVTGPLPGSWRNWQSLQDVRFLGNQVPRCLIPTPYATTAVSCSALTYSIASTVQDAI